MNNLSPSNKKLTLAEFRAEIEALGVLQNDDLVQLFLSLFKQITAIHEDNKVANIRYVEKLNVEDKKIVFDTTLVSSPERNIQGLKAITKNSTGLFEITDRIKEEVSVGSGEVAFSSQEVRNKEEITVPVYLKNYKSYEAEIGHYDQKTELFIAGMLMASFAFNLDFNDENDLKKFVENKNHLYYLNSNLHPTLLLIISQLTELDRNKRTRETRNLIWQLENYKDYNAENETDITLSEGFNKQKRETRNSWVLQKLKSRLFDLSRRNKLLYFKPSSSFLNLTMASVPTVLYYENIKEKDLFLWNAEVSKKIKNQDKISLSKYLQLDDAGYIRSNLDKIRVEARKDIYEYGFSQLKLVLAFLNWYNFKENKDEKIKSPLLILPVTITKKKGVKDDFTLEFNSSEAEVNPLLVYQLKELYDIDLPESVDLEKVNLLEFYEKINQLISKSNSIKLSLYDKPRIKLIQSIAKQKISQHNKKVRYRTQEFNVSKFSYSYNKDSYTPLGHQIYQDYVKPSASYLEYLIDDEIQIKNHSFSDTKVRDLYTVDDDGKFNPYLWEYDVCNMTLGNFNYKKMSLVRDYSTILETDGDNPSFNELFSDAPKKLADAKEEINAYEDNFYVLNADATQGLAISKANKGESLIIQGPPGTGKSQTITNLIADFTSQGKRILFVCEKRAALDVVYARLKQNNIHHLASLIHDSQTDKKEFILDAKSTYEKFVEETDEYEAVKKLRNEKKAALKKELSQIDAFHQILQTTFAEIGISLIEFIEKLLLLRSENNISEKIRFDKQLDFKTWQDSSSVLVNLSEELHKLGYDRNPSIFSLKTLSKNLINDNNAISKSEDGINYLLSITDEWSELAEMYEFNEEFNWELSKLRTYCQFAKIVFTINQTSNERILKANSPEAKEFDAIHKEFQKTQVRFQEIIAKNENWRSKLPEAEAEAALETARKLEGKFYAFLVPSYRKLKNVLKSSYNFDAHAINPKLTSVLENLVDEHKEEKRCNELENSIKNFGVNNINDVELINSLRSDKIYREKITSKGEETLKVLAVLEGEFNQITETTNLFGLSPDKNSSKMIAEKASLIQADLKTLPILIPYLKDFVQLPQSIIDLVRSTNNNLAENTLLVAEDTLDQLYKRNIEILNATGHSLRYSVNKIQKLHQELMALNGTYLVEKYKSQFKAQLHNSTLLAKDQTQQDKLDKKAFLKARRILENEFGKSIRYKSIRDLKSSESSFVLDMLKPIWLMSPLSVSDTLPVNNELFDVVIFDEASQITLEECVPTLFRSKQVIIVGDEMQMPPTNFFSTANSVAKEELEDSNSIQISIDADSMLTHASKKLEDVMLSWHYRSKYEGLIGFSNGAFYNGNLLTIPDQDILVPQKEKENASIVDRIQEEVISFHFQEDGIYSNRKNNAEAIYIAEMVQELLCHNPELSIGIVAFSMQQQENIENTIENLAAKNPEFAEQLENAYNKTEDGQQIGLFIKNLENVQGDERDVIIISICYGYNEKNKMLMNFGPINRKGGEKRLNVIFSRAKKHMAIVSSIVHSDIKNEYNEGANYLRRFLQYAENLSQGNMKLSQEILESLSAKTNSIAQESKKTNTVSKEICKFLETLGYEYETDLGLSKFKISIGVKNPEDKSNFILGILLDSSSFYSNENTLDKYVLRPNLLNSFNWKNLTIFKKDWLDNPELVKELIKGVLQGNQEEFEEEINDKLPADSPVETHIDQNLPEETITESPENKETSKVRLEFSEGASDKFWCVEQKQNTLEICFGRIGTNGRTIIKEFENNEVAESQMSKLINDKKKKGYVIK